MHGNIARLQRRHSYRAAAARACPPASLHTWCWWPAPTSWPAPVPSLAPTAPRAAPPPAWCDPPMPRSASRAIDSQSSAAGAYDPACPGRLHGGQLMFPTVRARLDLIEPDDGCLE